MALSESAADTEPVEIVIDFRPDPRHTHPDVVSQITTLYDDGILEREISKRLRVARSTVTRILDDRDAAQGTVRPDGRVRRASLPVKHLTPPEYQQVADRVKALADEDRLFDEIAEALDLDRNTVTSAWRFWHESRGLPVPDGRTRRKSLERKSRESGDQCSTDPDSPRPDESHP